MKQVLGYALMVMMWSATGTAVMGQLPGQSNAVYQIQQTQIDLRLAEAELAAATKTLTEKKSMVDKGLAPDSDLRSAETTVMAAQSRVELLRNQLGQQETTRQQDDRLAALRRPVAVELRDAPVRQAAQTLSQASGITISVEKSVPTDKRLTVVAQGVPLATVLDTIARQTGLLIAPEGNGVLLKAAPSLEVNGQRAELMSPIAPWSSEWGENPAGGMFQQFVGFGGGSGGLGGGFGGGGLGGGGFAGASRAGGYSPAKGSASTPAPPGPALGAPGGPSSEAPGAVRRTPDVGYGSPGAVAAPVPAPGFGGFGGGGLGGGVIGGIGSFGGGLGGGGFGGDYSFAASGPPPVTMTALSSNTFVVANPATGPQGEPAVMLTVYRLEGTTLRKVSSALHRLGPTGGRRGGAVGFGQPGGFGMGGAGRGGYGGGGFGAPGASPQAAPGFFRNSPFSVPPSSGDPRAVPPPGGAGAPDQPDVLRAPAPADAAPTPAPVSPPADSAPVRGR